MPAMRRDPPRRRANACKGEVREAQLGDTGCPAWLLGSERHRKEEDI